jgi:hypothetical protein
LPLRASRCAAARVASLTRAPAQAYVRDAVRPDEYEAACLDLIAKFKTLRTALREDGVPDVEHFMATYQMDCSSAAARLLRSGVPATIEHGKPRCARERARAETLWRALTQPARAPPGRATTTPRQWLRRRRSTSSRRWTR